MNNSSISIPVSVLLLAGVVLLPWYPFKSGGLQPSHALIALACVYALVHKVESGYWATSLMLGLALLVAGREAIAVIGGTKPSDLLNAAYLLFNCMFIAVLIRQPPSRVPWVQLAVWLSVLVAVSSVVVLGYGAPAQSGLRPVGSFNNPNQLGYYAVCMFSLAALFRLTGVAGAVATCALVGMSIFLAVASLSKAAMLACGFGLVFLPFVMFGVNRRARVYGGLALFILGAMVLVYLLVFTNVFDGLLFIRRLQNIGQQSDDNLAARGYLVWQQASGWEVVFGLGKQGVKDIVGHEIHATIMSFYGMYGLIGGGIFTALMAMWGWTVLRAFGWLGVMVLFVPAMVYGLPHNGSRFVGFWLLVGLTLNFARHFGRSAVVTERLQGLLPATNKPLPG